MCHSTCWGEDSLAQITYNWKIEKGTDHNCYCVPFPFFQKTDKNTNWLVRFFLIWNSPHHFWPTFIHSLFCSPHDWLYIISHLSAEAIVMGGESLQEVSRCCSRCGESIGGRFIWRVKDERWGLMEMWEAYVSWGIFKLSLRPFATSVPPFPNKAIPYTSPLAMCSYPIHPHNPCIKCW